MSPSTQTVKNTPTVASVNKIYNVFHHLKSNFVNKKVMRVNVVDSNQYEKKRIDDKRTHDLKRDIY